MEGVCVVAPASFPSSISLLFSTYIILFSVKAHRKQEGRREEGREGGAMTTTHSKGERRILSCASDKKSKSVAE